MRKRLLLSLVALSATIFGQSEYGSLLYAQEVDCTSYILNAGFDEDLTWQADGSKKATFDTKELSNRSIAAIAADSSLYATVNPSTPKQRSDGRTFEATNGFKGRIQGWTLETNGDFPSCEWTYFGSVPYDLGETAIPISDDGNTYLTVPTRPNEFDGGDGFVYMRAGWGGRATYKQIVKLPCAQYRLEYWSININPSGMNGKNLSKVTCRKDTWPDETRFSSTEWTKHEIEFTPTAEFTMEFGFESSGGSNSNPFLCIDGIKLYKIGEADPDEINMSDLFDMAAECQSLAGEATSLGATALAAYIGDYGMELEDIDFTGDELGAAVRTAYTRMAEIRAAIAQIENVVSMLEKMDNLMQTKDFPGKADFQTAYERILNYIEGYPVDGEDVVAEILGAVEEGNAAIKAYYMSQMDNVSEENPADFTIFINHNWFIKDEYAPVFEEGSWVFPHADEGGYYDGSGNADFSSDGWKVTGTFIGGDQRLSYRFGYPCWNAWGSGINGTIAVGQTIEGLPNGYYTVSAMLVTQSGCLTDQHVYAESTLDKKISDPLTSEGWDEGYWETVAMTAEQKVLVVDGKLTIGAEGTGMGYGSVGWFCATNFQLTFLGLASEDEINTAIANVYTEKIDEAKEFAKTMHFKGDKNDFDALISVYENVSAERQFEAIQVINYAMESAQLSESKYREYFPEDEYLVDGYIMREVAEGLSYNYYDDANDIAQFAYDKTMEWLNNEDAHYYDFSFEVNRLDNYVNYYIPYYLQANELRWEASDAGLETLDEVMARQKDILTSEMQYGDVIDAFVTELKEVIFKVKKQNIWDNERDTKDYTAFIQNPNLEVEDGWEFQQGNGFGYTNRWQWFDDSDTRYIDSYNGSGLRDFKALQLVTGLPNGIYKVGVYTRTPAEGAYIFANATVDKFVEIPLSYHATVNEYTGEETLVVASDKWGPIWEDAKAILEDGYAYNNLSWEEQERIDYIYNANNGEGRGWKYQEIDNIVVNNHQLLIGAMAGTGYDGTAKVFEGNWFSAGGWTLTMVSEGDNSNWNGPMSDAGNKLYIAEGTTLSRGRVATLPISLSNDEDILGLQFEVVLPGGMAISHTTLNSDRAYDHSINYNVMPDGTIRMMVTSWNNEQFFGNDGVLLNIGVEVPAYMPFGDYAVTLKNVILTNIDRQTIKCADKTFAVKVGGKLGDVNNDDLINVTDVVMIIDHILQRDPMNFNEAMADVDGNGTINVTDVVKVIDVILGRAELSRTATREYSNLSDYTAFQMDLTIPAGYVLESVSLTDIAKESHTLAYNMLADGRCRVVVWSMDNEALPGVWNEVIRLNLRGQGDAQVNIDHAAFVTIGGEYHELQLNGTTAITQLSTLDSQLSTVYDLQGRKVEKNHKGIVLSNGKKNIKK